MTDNNENGNENDNDTPNDSGTFNAYSDSDTVDFPDKWEFEDISRALMSMNESITSDGIGNATLQGAAGFHVFADTTDGPATAFPKALHAAIYEATEEIHVDHREVEREYGEVTPDTVTEAFVDRINDYGINHLIERIEYELTEQLEAYATAEHLHSGDGDGDDDREKSSE